MNPTLSSIPSLTTDSVQQAAQWLNSGRLLAYPTESVWGIGCDPFNETAVQQLLALKQRPLDKGMIVITDTVDRIAPLLNNLSNEQRKMVLGSWQLPLNSDTRQAHTWLLPLHTSLSQSVTEPLTEPLEIPIPAWITGAHNSVAVRVIAHPLIKQLCAQLVSPLNPYGFMVSTSCNPSGQPPALSLVQAQNYFNNSEFAQQVAYLQGNTLGYELPSQISDALTGQIIR